MTIIQRTVSYGIFVNYLCVTLLSIFKYAKIYLNNGIHWVKYSTERSWLCICYQWEGRIPSLYYCDISGNGTFTEGKYTLNGTIDINCSPVEDTPDVKFEKFVLVTELNGEEINREDISEDVLNYEAYPHGVYWRDEYKMECAAQEGDEIAIYVEATDSLGYVHRRLLHFWKEYKGAMAEAVDASEYIFDPNGVQIFP